MKKQRALIVDDHPVALIGCANLLKEVGYEVIDRAVSASMAVELIDENTPDLIVLDLGLPGLGGLELLPRLKNQAPNGDILVFTMNDSPAFAALAIDAGASGFLSKDSAPEDFIKAVQIVGGGGIYIHPSMARELSKRKARNNQSQFEELSDLEWQVLHLIGQNMSYDQIAEEVQLSRKSVANVSSILKKKLHARSLSDLIRLSIAIDTDVQSGDGD